MTEPSPAKPAESSDRYSRILATETFLRRSRLIAPELRPVIAAYCEFVRAAAAVADDRAVDRTARIADLDALDAILASREYDGAGSPALESAQRLRAEFTRYDIAPEHARHLVQAFKADVMCRASRSWSDLLAYCRYAAAPVGRFLLELHGEDRTGWLAAEALGVACEILSRLQSCPRDWSVQERCYLPQDWLREAGTEAAALLNPRSSPALRVVFDRVLDGVDRLLETANSLPRLTAHRRLRMQIESMLVISRRLARRLRRRDPLAAPIHVTLADERLAVLFGAVRGWWR